MFSFCIVIIIIDISDVDTQLITRDTHGVPPFVRARRLARVQGYFRRFLIVNN